MENYFAGTGFLGKKTRKHLLFLKITMFIMVFLLTDLSANVYSQSSRINLKLKQGTLSEVLMEIQKETVYNVLFNVSDVKAYNEVTVAESNVEINTLMESVLNGTNLEYEIVDQNIVVRTKKRQDPVKRRKTIRGKVADSEGLPLPGVHIIIESDGEQKIATSSNNSGTYSIIYYAESDFIINFSSVGMKKQSVDFDYNSADEQVLNIVLETEVSEVDEVVITGFFERKKDTYTGVTSTVSGVELIEMGTKNVLESLNQLDPSFRILENNEFGSDPNKLPEISFRGASSFENVLDDSDLNLLKTDPNLPTFVLDGFVVSLQDVVDLDMNRIESVTILKDAVAAVVYGSYAANGVFVIKTKDPEVGKMRVSYSGNYSVNVPDLGSYDLLNAAELLEFQERIGLMGMDFEQEDYFADYMQARQWVYEGVDTDWKYHPVQNSLTQQHSINLSGGDKSVRYGLGANYNDSEGVMKGSGRTNLAINMNLDYHISDKLNFSNRLSVTSNTSDDSNYGIYSDYLSLPGYFPLYDKNGQMMETWRDGYWNNRAIYNPLLEAEAGNFKGSEYTNVINNLSFNWNITSKLKITSRLGYGITKTRSENFLSPMSLTYITSELADDERGEYEIINSKSENITLNLMLNYTVRKENHVLTSTVGGTLAEANALSEGMTLQGFSNNKYFPSFAKGYEVNGLPRAFESTLRNAGLLASVNYSYRNVFLIDGAFRMDGSSAFGNESKFAPFFSVGSGFNFSNTKWVQNIDWLNTLRISATYGEMGSVSFSPYQAKDMFSYYTDARYRGRIGVSLKALGNESLVWQTTKSKELAFSFSVFDDLIDFSGSVYNRRTVDMIAPITLPSSNGYKSMVTNQGEMLNKGLEMNMRSVLYKNKNSNLVFSISAGHNENTIEALSGGLKAYNERIKEIASNSKGEEYNFISQFQEGRSIDDLYAVRSLGIDPQTGREVFLDKDGIPTWEWNSEDMVVVGNSAPKVEGSSSINYSYKRFSCSVSGMYRYGGQAYNTTLLNKVENSNKWMNVDRRAFDKTWQKPGDIAPYKANANGAITRASSRFIQDNNQFAITSVNFQYRIKPELCKKLLMSSLSLGLSMNDILHTSTIKRERGTSYPYAHSYSLRINANF